MTKLISLIVRSECQKEREIKREQHDYTVTQMNQLTYEIKEEIRRQAEEVENKVNIIMVLRVNSANKRVMLALELSDKSL